MNEYKSNISLESKNLNQYKALLEIENQKESLKSKENYWRAYVLSIIIPLLGIYYFIKFIFFEDGTQGNQKAGIISLILTMVSLLINIWFINQFFKQTLQVNNQDINFLKELITPENQESLKQLLQ